MAKKNRPKTKNRKKKILTALVCLVALLAIWIGVEIVRTVTHNNNVKKTLKEVRQEQRELKKRIEANDPSIQASDTYECQEKSAGFGSMGTECVQRLEIKGKYGSIEELENAATRINSVLQSYQPKTITINFESLVLPTPINTNTDYSYGERITSQNKKELYCAADYDVYSPREVNPQDRNTLELYAYCKEDLRGDTANQMLFVVALLFIYVIPPAFAVTLFAVVAYGIFKARQQKKK